MTRLWLRWCVRETSPKENCQGQVIPTGAEGQEVERQRAARLRESGINPDEV